jgi:branched-chain amino acid aminotransferase
MGDRIVIWRVSADIEDGVDKLDPANVCETLNEATCRLPAGAYTTFRTFGRTFVLRLSDHYQRLEQTALLAGTQVKLNRERIAQALRAALTDFPADEMRVRVTLDLTQVVGTVYILIERLHVPSKEEYTRGVRTITRQMQRDNPKAKLTQFIETAAVVRQGLGPDINEALMVGDDNRILEGLSSNFFAVKDGIIWTAEEDVLAGITRSLVLDVISGFGLPIEMSGVRLDAVEALDEAFITSASRAVLPVIEIDRQAVGNGRPGPVTKKLLQGYVERVESELEAI